MQLVPPKRPSIDRHGASTRTARFRPLPINAYSCHYRQGPPNGQGDKTLSQRGKLRNLLLSNVVVTLSGSVPHVQAERWSRTVSPNHAVVHLSSGGTEYAASTVDHDTQ